MKATNYTDVKNLMIVINFNQPIEVDGVQKIQPVVVDVRGEATTPENAIRHISAKSNVGNPVDTALTGKQIYNAINKTGTGATLANILKTAYIEAINEDVSV